MSMAPKSSTIEEEKCVQEYFDDNVRGWERMYDEQAFDTYNLFDSHTVIKRKEYVLQLLDESKESRWRRVLDIGCGPGIYMVDLLQRGMDVWGVDVAPKMIEQAISTAKDMGLQSRVHFSVASVENLPFPDEYFDVIICIGVLEYLSKDDLALKEIYRVLKPHGIAIITIWNHLSLGTFMDLYSLIKVVGKKTYRLVFPLNSSDMKKQNEQEFRKSYNVRRFDNLLQTHGLRKVNFISHRFGPIAINRKAIFSDATNIKITEKIEKISKIRWVPLLRELGTMYIMRVEKTSKK